MNEKNSIEISQLFPSWLLRPKTHPTKQRIALLERTALLLKLDDCLSRKLSLIHAPAGYGKSTLLTIWRNRILEQGIKVCWLSLDKEDNEALQLRTYIAFALSEGGLNFHNAGITDKETFKNLSLQSFLSIINRVIEFQQGRVVLILDDFENINEQTIDKVIRPLLDCMPDNLHITIASRDDTYLKITDLELQGQVMHIDAKNLRFTIDDLGHFFADLIPKNSIKQIYQLTEGWPVAIQMLKNTIKSEQDIKHIISDFNNSNTMLASYLSEQVFQSLDSNLQGFLMNISLLDRVSCEFADYLRESDDSKSLFHTSNSLDALVLQVEKVDETYRLHPLLREYLYKKLAKEQPSKKISLHLRIADWFEQHNDMVSAVRHCMLANNPEKAIKIIENAGGIMLWMQEGIIELEKALALLDKNSIKSSSRIILIDCLLDAKKGKVHQARLKYDAIESSYRKEAPKLSLELQQQISYEMMLVESSIAIYEGTQTKPGFCQKLKQELYNQATDEKITQQLSILLCVTYLQKGLFNEARGYAEQAILTSKQSGSIFSTIYSSLHLGGICFAEGKSQQAKQYYQTALNLTRQHFNDDQHIKLATTILLSELKYELNTSISHVIETVPKQLEKHEAWFDLYAAGYTIASNIEFNKYGLNAALAIIERAEDYANSQKLTNLSNLLTFQRINLLLKYNMPEDAQTVFDESELQLGTYQDPINKNIAWRERDAAAQNISRLLIKQNKLEQALSVLKHFAEYAQTYGHVISRTRYDILQSVIYYKMEKSQQSFKHLKQALKLVQQSGFVRCFIDESEDISIILNNYTDTASKNDLKQVNDLLQLIKGDTKVSDTESLLSKREYEVLQQLANGLSNKLIARSINVSENTVLFHLKNVFAKLHVKSRIQAVIEARKKNLLD